MKSTIALLLSITVLSGCEGYASKYQTIMSANQQTEAEAMNRAQPEKDKCANGKDASKMTPKAYLSYMKCMVKLTDEQIIPVAVYPDLFQKFTYTNLENASLYAQGKIGYEQVVARERIAGMEYATEAQRRTEDNRRMYASYDDADRANLSQALKGLQPPRPVYTSCSSFGRTINCTSNR